MSWSISAVGKPKAVAAKLAQDFARNPCAQPEESFRQGVASIVAKALEVFPAGHAVEVQASGSQSVTYGDGPSAGVTNQLSFTIKPLYGFVE